MEELHRAHQEHIVSRGTVEESACSAIWGPDANMFASDHTSLIRLMSLRNLREWGF